MEGKKLYVNHWRRNPFKPVPLPYSPSPKKRRHGDEGFRIDVTDVGLDLEETKHHNHEAPRTPTK
jgi:hypothetical protein